ncbi:AbrB family transcriptional regulator [Caulobacter sp. 1776]|uniref:AbrB family transcriptional regulator n=1 Tax=Caulobacter sp. 1776 TaxID=3156420 RepID=UPI0033963364
MLLASATTLADIGLVLVHAPAALLLGPLVCAIAFGVCGATVRPPGVMRLASSSLIGCLVAVSLGAALGPALLGHLPTFVLIGVSTVALSLGLGWTLARAGWFEGATSVWGLSPGGAASMVALAQETGADARTVAMMQYFRVLLVAAAAIGLSHVASPGLHAAPAKAWLGAVEPRGLAETAILALTGALLSKALKFPAGVFLIPGLAGAVLIKLGWMHPQAPPLLGAMAYAVVGWNIGLSFTPASLAHSARAMPRIVGSTLILIALCGLSGLAISLAFGVDPLTGYLSTSPGGVDSILIIAASTRVDLPFILAAQVMRIILVLMIGPWAAARVARWSLPKATPRPPNGGGSG